MLFDPDLFGTCGPASRDGDAVWTPDWVAADMVGYFKPRGVILEPCRGGGAFMRSLPSDALWCEITEGHDFFAFSRPVDWIITNPPFSIMPAFLLHAMELAGDVCFLLPAHSYFRAYGLVRKCAVWGGIFALRWYGGGARLGFPMGNAIAAIHWRKGHGGSIVESFFDPPPRREERP